MKLELRIPESWEDVTLRQYIQLVKLHQTKPVDNVESLQRRWEELSILNPDVDKGEIGKLTTNQLKSYYENMKFMADNPVTEKCDVFNIDGKEYKFIDFRHLSLEQWIDSEKYSQLEDVNKLIAIFYITPKEYDNLIHEKVSDWLLEQPVTKTFWSVSFFLTMQKALELALEDYTLQMSKKMKKLQTIIEKSIIINEKLRRARRWLGFKS